MHISKLQITADPKFPHDGYHVFAVACKTNRKLGVAYILAPLTVYLVKAAGRDDAIHPRYRWRICSMGSSMFLCNYTGGRSLAGASQLKIAVTLHVCIPVHRRTGVCQTTRRATPLEKALTDTEGSITAVN